jgi:hypothetical protein
MADAIIGEMAGAGAGEILSPNKDASGHNRPHAGQDLANFLLAVAGDAGNAENFTSAYVD